MARRTIQIRVTEGDQEWIALQATAAGESISEFVRTAALARAWMEYARRNKDQIEGLETVYQAAARALGEDAARRRGDG